MSDPEQEQEEQEQDLDQKIEEGIREAFEREREQRQAQDPQVQEASAVIRAVNQARAQTGGKPIPVPGETDEENR